MVRSADFAGSSVADADAPKADFKAVHHDTF
jgi:hypothetical protein